MVGASRIVCAAAAVLLIVACEKSPRGSEDAEVTGPPLEAKLDRRIGSTDDSATNLTQIADIIVDRNGRLYVAQPREYHVKVFSPDGKRLVTIARRGEGPGELGQLTRVGWVGDTLQLLDAVRGTGRRTHYFAPAGELVRTGSAPAVRFDSTTRLAHATAAVEGGRWVVAPSRGAMERHEKRLPILLVDSAGGTPQQIADLRRLRASLSFEGGSLTIPKLADSLEDGPLVVVPPDGKWVAVVDRYAAKSASPHHFSIARFSPSGTLEWRKEFAYDPRPLPPAGIETIIRTAAGTIFKRPGISEAAARQLAVDLIEPIEFTAPVMSARPGIDGSLWLLPSDQGAGAQTWWVIDPTGARTRLVRFPRGFNLRLGGADFALGAETDSLDVPFVARYVFERGR